MAYSDIVQSKNVYGPVVVVFQTIEHRFLYFLRYVLGATSASCFPVPVYPSFAHTSVQVVLVVMQLDRVMTDVLAAWCVWCINGEAVVDDVAIGKVVYLTVHDHTVQFVQSIIAETYAFYVIGSGGDGERAFASNAFSRVFMQVDRVYFLSVCHRVFIVMHAFIEER